MTRELGAIVGDKPLGYSETTDDVLLDEVLDFLRGDVCDWFCLHPLGEVFDGHDEKLHLPYRQGKRS